MNNRTLELYKWLKESGQNDFVHPKLVKNIWVIHFGEISSILKANGFTLGEPNFEKLNSTDSYEKTEEGFDFAYRLNDITELASRACINQGEQKAIVFKCSGILAYHQTDSDPSNEVIFYGSDADLSNYYVLEYNKMECYGKIYREWKFSDKNGNNIDIYYNNILGEYTSYIPYNKLSKTLTNYFKNLNESKYMKKQIIRITENDLHWIINDAVQHMLMRENFEDEKHVFKLKQHDEEPPMGMNDMPPMDAQPPMDEPPMPPQSSNEPPMDNSPMNDANAPQMGENEPPMGNDDEGGDDIGGNSNGNQEIDDIFDGLSTEDQAAVIKYARSMTDNNGGSNNEPPIGNDMPMENKYYSHIDRIVEDILSREVRGKDRELKRPNKDLPYDEEENNNPFISKR